MAEDLGVRVFRARLNYQDVKGYNPEWGHTMINDYLGITEGTVALADQIDSNTIGISVNTINIEKLQEITAGHQAGISAIKGRAGANSKKIVENTNNIAQNASVIEDNVLAINDIDQLVNRVWR